MFNVQDLIKVDEAVLLSEELINNYFKLSSGQWLKNRYDVKTAKDLEPHEFVEGPFAQVVKYEGRKKEVPLGSSSFSFYTICLQDEAVLSTVENNDSLSLKPFLIYIVTHELVHIVRFLKFAQRYEKSSNLEHTMEEECRVHNLTYQILSSVKVRGLDDVFKFYEGWRREHGM
ncbi:MAG: hypothetical protein GY729_15155 [Desulfobacteraceae bacterium]|nr:hypothetical protein [Desulfobacteraceae bacterium]